jgi:lipopolysaccharide transport system permease protein
MGVPPGERGSLYQSRQEAAWSTGTERRNCHSSGEKGEVAIEESDAPAPGPDVPPPQIRYRRALHLRSEMRELWDARPVVFSLTERDLRSRYSQMVLGFVWTIIGPLLLTLVIALVLNKTNVEPPFGVPRAVWIYTAMMPWTFFSGAVSSGGIALISNNSLLNKVYVPREVFPISQILGQIVSSVCGVVAFIALLAVSGFMPKATTLWIPIPLIIGLMFTAAVTILIAGLTVYFRDLRQAIPVLLQLGLFVNPIAWDFSKLSTSVQPFYVAADPLASVINDMRRCILYGQAPDWPLSAIAFVVSAIELFVAYVIFKQMEAGFADVA